MVNNDRLFYEMNAAAVGEETLKGPWTKMPKVKTNDDWKVSEPVRGNT